MKAYFIILLTALAVIFSSSFVFADNNSDTQFMFKFKKNCQKVMLADYEENNIDTVSENLNIYKADYDTIQRLMADGLIENIEEDVPVQLADSYDYSEFYNDTYFKEQWYFNKQNIGKAKSVLGTGKGVRIAVIDSGVTIQDDFNSANIEKGYNYINPDKTGNYISENDNNVTKSHGTKVAGIICSKSNNRIGIAGIAEDAVIVPLIIYQDGKSPLSNVISAIDDAVRVYDCDVINMSITCPSNSEMLQEAINYANDNNVIIIAAAGNEGRDSELGTRYLYPAACENVIGVGSVNDDFSVSAFSQKNDYVDIAAAGNNIMSVNYEGKYSTTSGTSFASPVVAGFAAILKEKYPDMNHEKFLSVLKAGSMDIVNTGYDIYSGFGVFDAWECLEFLDGKSDFFVSPVYESSSGLKVKVFGNNVSGILIFAVYDSGGKLKYINTQDFTTSNKVFCKNIEYIPEEDDKIKIFAFDSIYSMKPLGKSRLMAE